MALVYLNNLTAGAPTVTLQQGKFYDLFKWALPKLGWAIEHDNAEYATALFMGTNGKMFKVADRYHESHALDDDTYAHPFILAMGTNTSDAAKTPKFTLMPGTGGGWNSIQDTTLTVIGSSTYISKWRKTAKDVPSDTDKTKTVNWHIIGDNNAFYFIHQDPLYAGELMWYCDFFGDIVPLGDMIKYKVALTGTYYPSHDSWYGEGMFSRSNTTTHRFLMMTSPSEPLHSTSDRHALIAPEIQTVGRPYNPVNGDKIEPVDHLIGNENGVMGKMPGLMIIPHDRPVNCGEDITINSTKYKLFYYDTGNCVAIKAEGDWYA